MSKHTPGPWRAERATASREVWHICSDVQGCIASVEGKAGGAALANARFIKRNPRTDEISWEPSSLEAQLREAGLA